MAESPSEISGSPGNPPVSISGAGGGASVRYLRGPVAGQRGTISGAGGHKGSLIRKSLGEVFCIL